MPSTHSLPRKVQDALDHGSPLGIQRIITEALADAWDEGYRRRDPNNAAPMAGDNPYRVKA